MKLFKKFEFSLTIITLITFDILSVMLFLSGKTALMLLILVAFIFTLVDLISQLKKRKNIKR
jgi:hypothetical protein